MSSPHVHRWSAPLFLLFGLVGVFGVGCTVRVDDLAGKACDDTHPCAEGRVCNAAGFCVAPGSESVDGGSSDGGNASDGGADAGGGPCTDTGQPCTVGSGACARSGTYACDNGAQVCVADATDAGFPEEVCDGIDNDCDGQIDEGLTAPACPLDQGVCSGATAKRTCQGAQGWSACDYGAGYEANAETKCDGLDNDCDGQVDDVSGCLHTFAGIGPPGHVDGAGATAQFSGPGFMDADSAGNLYVADWDNESIRKIAPDGSVSTIIGQDHCGNMDGPLSVAMICNPYAVVVGPNGELYVSDTWSAKIRKIENGSMSTLAGTGTPGFADGPALSAQFNEPSGLKLLPNGDLLIADAKNGRIRRYVAATQTVSTEAGSGTGNLNGTKLVLQLNEPRDVEVGPSNELYVSESRFNRIRLIPVAGTSSVFAGQPGGGSGYADGIGTAIQFDYPYQLQVDTTMAPSPGVLLVADGYNYQVRAVPLNGTSASFPVAGGSKDIQGYANGLGPSAQFAFLHGFVKTNGLYFLADDNHVVRKVTPNASFATSLVEPFAGPDNPHLAIDGPLATARMTNPDAMTRAPDGTLYWVEGSNHLLRRLQNGVVTTLSGNVANPKSGYLDGTLASSQFQYPQGLGLGPDGRLYVSDTFNQVIRVVDLGANTVSTFAGILYGNGFNDGALGTAKFADPTRIVFTPQGELILADRGNNLIRKILLPNGPVSTYAGTPGKSGSVDGPVGTGALQGILSLAVDAAGNVYVADQFRIRKIPAGGGSMTTLAQLPSDAYSLAVDGNRLLAGTWGNLYAVDLSTGAVSQIVSGGWGFHDGFSGEVAFEGIYDVVPTQNALLLLDHQARRLRQLWR